VTIEYLLKAKTTSQFNDTPNFFRGPGGQPDDGFAASTVHVGADGQPV
jgi:hypothetical protein